MKILKIRDHGEMADRAAEWFHQKWSIPLEEYQESMAECLKKEKTVPQWYIAVEQGRITGGLGVIENDFHERKDLTPNVCAVKAENPFIHILFMTVQWNRHLRKNWKTMRM